jgi:hypothetical protein
MRRKIASQDGAAMVEFALLLIPLMIITFGIIEVGLLVYNSQVISNASREGTRAGIIATDPRLPLSGTTSITSVVTDYCYNHLFPFDPQNLPRVTSPNHSLHAAFDSTLTVEVNYTYSFLVLSNFIPGIKHNLQAITSMKYE